MVKNGLVPGAAASEAIVKHMNQMYTGTATSTFTGTAATYQNATENLNNAMGEGYQDERLMGLHDQSQWLNGETGQQMKRDYKRIGGWQAKIENEKERVWREAFEELYGTEEYKEAKRDNDYAKLSALYNQTWAMAEENWMQTGMYQQEMSMKNGKQHKGESKWLLDLDNIP